MRTAHTGRLIVAALIFVTVVGLFLWLGQKEKRPNDRLVAPPLKHEEKMKVKKQPDKPASAFNDGNDIKIISPKDGEIISDPVCRVEGKVRNARDGDDFVELFVVDNYGDIWPQGRVAIVCQRFQGTVHIGDRDQLFPGGKPIGFWLFAKIPSTDGGRESAQVLVRRAPR